jgi:excisionase family DNA binding protein
MADKLPDDLIAPKVLARILRVHVSTVHRWIKKAKLRAWRRGGQRYLISEAEGRALIAPVTVTPSEAPRSRAEEELAAEQATARLKAKWGG